MTELTDAEARTLIATATGETLFVEAGAGTGKTTALVGRVLALIREGVRVDEIAAITFTEKAASELSEKVRKKLEEEAEKAKGPEGDRLRSAIKDLDQAAIQTLHSFAMRILSLYPLEAGLPPKLALRDDVAATLAFNERWQRFQDEMLDDPSLERHLLRGLTVGLRLQDLQGIADHFNENWERIETLRYPSSEEPVLDAGAVLRPLEEVSVLRRAGAEDTLTEKLDALAGFMGFLRGVQQALVGATTADERFTAETDFLRLLARVEKLTKPRWPARVLGNKSNWDTAHVRDLMGQAEAARSEMLSATRSAVLCALMPRIGKFVRESATERQKQGELEFHDLLVLARDLLKRDSSVREALNRRFSRILIDEFQDTDPLQAELAALLASRDGTIGENWESTHAEPGRLFFVGDPKQSIYRFRRADIELFKRARGAFASRHVPLRKNFRCRPGIIDWVNLVAGELFTGFGSPADARQADWIPLEPGRDAVKSPTVHLLGGPQDVPAHELRQAEANAIVAAIRSARDDNWLKGTDPKRKETRFADIAILLPTRTNSPAIERALGDADIPVRVESRSLLFAAQEIRDLTNILAAVDDPTDDVAVVAALRSPYFAVEDGDLLAHVNLGGRWDYTARMPEGTPEPVASGMASLKSFHEARWHASIGALVERIVAERRMLELAVTTARPRESWRRLRFVSEQARALGDSGTVASLRQFVHWLRTQASEGARIAEAVANEPDDDAVRLLTIHAAKGLEFPIVILAGLGIPPRNNSPRVAWDTSTAGTDAVEARTGRQDAYFETPGYERLRLQEREHGFLERDRLFYVAATRARERLVVSAFYKPLKEEHSLRHSRKTCAIAECIDALHARHPEWDVLQHGMAMGAGVSAEPGGEDTPEDRAGWLAARKATVARMGSARVLAATTIAHESEAPGEDEEPPPEVEDQPWRKGRAGTSVGRAVHAVLQTLDLATGDGLADVARSQALAEGIADQAARISRLAENARTSAPVQEAVASGKYWREVYIGTPIGGTLVEGFIDLLYDGPDGLVIVDYKTDSLRDDAAVDVAMERYQLQGAAYALVLEDALKRPVAECVFVFTEPRIDRRVADLDGAKAKVEAILREKLSAAGG